MSGRDITSGMVTALEANTIRPVLVGRLDILTDPITAWTGPGVFAPSGSGDAALDGQVFVSMAPFIELSNIVEDQGIGGPVTLHVSGHDLDEDLLRQIVRDKRTWRGRRAWLWLALLDVDEKNVVVDPMRIKAGIMTHMQVTRDASGATVAVTIDRDLGLARAAPFRWIDHPILFAADTWSTFILLLSNNPDGIGKPGPGSGPAPRPGPNEDLEDIFRDFT